MQVPKQFLCPLHKLPISIVKRQRCGISQGKCAKCLDEQEIPIDVVQQEYHNLAQERIEKLENFKQINEKHLTQIKDQFLHIREEFNRELNKIIQKITDSIYDVVNSMMTRINQIKDQGQTILKMEKCIVELKKEKLKTKQMYETIIETKNKQLMSDSVLDFTKLLAQLSCQPAKLKLFITPGTEKSTSQTRGNNGNTTSIDTRKRQYRQEFGQTGSSQIFKKQNPEVKLPPIKKQKAQQEDIKYASEADWKQNIQYQKIMLKEIIAKRGRKRRELKQE